MSSVLEVTEISVAGAPAVTVGVGTMNVNISNATTIPSVEVTVPTEVQTVMVEVPGLQGPPGVQNVYAQLANPAVANGWGPEEAGFIWIEVNV